MSSTSKMITLAHVNPAPAQTWNYLRINSMTLEVPATQRGEANLPDRFRRIESPVGPEATSWIDGAVYEPRVVTVPAHEELADPVLITVASDTGEISSAGVVVNEGASASIVVVVAREADIAGARISAGMQGAPDSVKRGIAARAAKADADAGRAGATRIAPEVGKSLPEEPVEAPVSGSMLRVDVCRNAQVRIYEYVVLPADCQHIEAVSVRQDPNSHVEVHQYLLGGKNLISGFVSELFGIRAKLELGARYLVAGGGHTDINQIARCYGQDTRVVFDDSGVLFDGAEKTLRDTIDLLCGCKGSKAREQETVVLTGDSVVNRSLPVILCDEEDVQGDHGATIGSMSPEQLQYLCDRGLAQEEAESLYTTAIIDDAAINAPVALAREVILARATELMGQEAARDLTELLSEKKEAE